MKKAPAEILRAHGLRVTDVRKSCIRLFEKAEGGISSAEIEKALNGVDRITLYRTLISFEEAGLVHYSIDGAGQKKYALCEGACNEHRHHDNHVHFHCTKCGLTKCLDDEVPSQFNLPSGYKTTEVQFNVMGVCAECG